MPELFTRPIDAIVGTSALLDMYAERITRSDFNPADTVKLVETQRELEAEVAAARAEDESIGQMLDELA